MGPIPQEVKMETESNDLNIPQKAAMETKSDDLKIPQKAAMETKSDDLKIPQKAVMETKSDDSKIPQKIAMEIKSDDSKMPQKVVMETKSKNLKILQKDEKRKDLIFDASKNTTIANIKAKIQKLKGIPANNQTLIFHGQKLENNHTLLDYKIQNANSLHLIVNTKNTTDNIPRQKTKITKSKQKYSVHDNSIKVIAQSNNMLANHHHQQTVQKVNIPIANIKADIKDAKKISIDQKFKPMNEKTLLDDEVQLTDTRRPNPIKRKSDACTKFNNIQTLIGVIAIMFCI